MDFGPVHGVDLDEFTTLISLKYLLQICFHCSPKFKSILYKNRCYGNGGYHFECQNLFSTIISLVLSLYYETNVISCIRRDFIQIQGIYLKQFVGCTDGRVGEVESTYAHRTRFDQ